MAMNFLQEMHTKALSTLATIVAEFGDSRRTVWTGLTSLSSFSYYLTRRRRPTLEPACFCMQYVVTYTKHTLYGNRPTQRVSC